MCFQSIFMRARCICVSRQEQDEGCYAWVERGVLVGDRSVWMCSIPFIHFSFQSSFIIEIKPAKFIQVATPNYVVVLVLVQYHARSRMVLCFNLT